MTKAELREKLLRGAIMDDLFAFEREGGRIIAAATPELYEAARAVMTGTA